MANDERRVGHEQAVAAPRLLEGALAKGRALGALRALDGRLSPIALPLRRAARAGLRAGGGVRPVEIVDGTYLPGLTSFIFAVHQQGADPHGNAHLLLAVVVVHRVALGCLFSAVLIL
mgnify:CR=1 FL=1